MRRSAWPTHSPYMREKSYIRQVRYGAGVSLEADAGPLQQFQPPSEDISFIDARSLAVRGTHEVEVRLH